MKSPRLLLPVVALAVLLALATMAWQWRVRLEGTHDQRVVRVGLYENAPKVYT
ncbi:MAG: hypothetical protein JSR88_07845, partial [Proteobacteria bacterium]|nr:hypothetical protein [Pseudomonadota bacterium]